jgi:hypothetical protein
MATRDHVSFLDLLPLEIRMLTLGLVHMHVYARQFTAQVMAYSHSNPDANMVVFMNSPEKKVEPLSKEVLDDSQLLVMVRAMFPQCVRVKPSWSNAWLNETACRECPFHRRWMASLPLNPPRPPLPSVPFIQ